MPDDLLPTPALAPARAWFAAQGFMPFPFQEEVWRAYAGGESGLIHAPTGMGKTYAAWMGPLVLGPAGAADAPPPLSVLWLTPLRALAADTGLALGRAAAALQPHWSVDVRTGDTAAGVRARQDRRLPTALVTTPESLTLLLSRADWRERFAHLAAVVVDEWHELMASKRGVQVELALARLRGLHRSLPTWGLSATLGNLDEALACLLGVGRRGRIVRGLEAKAIAIETARPPTIERFPWGGHIGLRLLPQVVRAIENGALDARVHQRPLGGGDLVSGDPRGAPRLGRAHRAPSRLARARRARLGRGRAAAQCAARRRLHVEPRPRRRLRARRPGAADRQPKGVARLLQRAGRSGHQPGAVSRITVVPTQALELVEAAAAREAAADRMIEPRLSVRGPLDALTQHLVTCALGGGFDPRDLLAELRGTHAYATLGDHAWQWALDFVVHGGASLNAYPEYRRVVIGDDGIARVPDARIARRHRMQIGTIVSDASITVQMRNGRRLGHVEESFIARLTPGATFVFAGRVLEFIRVREMTAWVKPGNPKSALVPRWAGSKMPLSSLLSDRTRKLIGDAKRGIYASEELQLVRPLLELQRRWSALPDEREWLVERIAARDGHYVFFYPFEGRLAHLGLATLFSYRLSRETPGSFSIMINDYGFGLASPVPIELGVGALGALLAAPDVERDILAGLNAAELGRRQFREIARVAGLVFQGYPGQPQSNRHLQASSGLLYDVFAEYDPDNLLLAQAVREVMERQLEAPRLAHALARLRGARAVLTSPARPTPFAFALMVEMFREKLTTEALEARVARMVEALEQAAAEG